MLAHAMGGAGIRTRRRRARAGGRTYESQFQIPTLNGRALPGFRVAPLIRRKTDLDLEMLISRAFLRPDRLRPTQCGFRVISLVVIASPAEWHDWFERSLSNHSRGGAPVPNRHPISTLTRLEQSACGLNPNAKGWDRANATEPDVAAA
ncbi:hypothetical protein SCAR479_05149 [Seiridium cardinale]|uniref:Uncharacterized protein n=1 Tax=Seiridium cardinale TaxID=138064 RepID=A0ABR2XWZ9_9PEZI